MCVKATPKNNEDDASQKPGLNTVTTRFSEGLQQVSL